MGSGSLSAVICHPRARGEMGQFTQPWGCLLCSWPCEFLSLKGLGVTSMQTHPKGREGRPLLACPELPLQLAWLRDALLPSLPSCPSSSSPLPSSSLWALQPATVLKPEEGTADLPAGRVRLCIDADKTITEVDEDHVHRVSLLSLPACPAPSSSSLQEMSL